MLGGPKPSVGLLEKLVRLVTQGCLADLHAEKGFEGKLTRWRLKAESVEESQEGLRDYV